MLFYFHLFLIQNCIFSPLPGLAMMSRLARNRLQSENGFEDRSIDWDSIEM